MYNGLMWLKDKGVSLNQSSAIYYCDNLYLGGYTDWRLPTVAELKGLVYCSNGKPTPLENNENCSDGDWRSYTPPTIDLSAFFCALEGYTTVDGTGSLGWMTSFINGATTQMSDASRMRVRCVRTQ